MKKTRYGKYPLVYPLPSILVGAVVNRKANYATLGNCGIMSVEPPVIYISSNKSNYTNIGILANMVFSINIPSVELMERVDYCGLVSGNSVNKYRVFTTFFENKDKIPMIEECPVNIACKVTKTIEVYDMMVFIGEIAGTHVSDECLTDGHADTSKINPLIYCMDNLYWSIGKNVGEGFRSGKKYDGG